MNRILTPSWLLALATQLVAQATDATAIDVGKALVASRSPAEDDPDAGARALLAALDRTAASPAALVLEAELGRLLQDVQDLDAVLQRVQALLASGRAHALLEHNLRVLAHGLLRRLGRHEQAAALDTLGSFAREWIVVGPFGDAGDYWHAVTFAPELTFPALGEALQGRYGQVRPRAVAREGHEPFVRFEEPGSPQRGCFYGLHQVEAANAVACYAEVWCRGAFELFVDGERRFACERLGTRVGSLFRIPIVLRKGTNALLLKTTMSQVSQVHLRLLDGAGKRPPGLTEIPAKSGVLPVAAGPDELAPPGTFVGPLVALEAALKGLDGEDRRLVELAAAIAAADADHGEAALAHALVLEADPPAAPAQRLALGRLVLQLETLPPEVRRQRARSLVEATLGKSDTHDATLLKATFLEDEDKREEATLLLEGVVAKKRAGPATFARLFALQRGLHFDAEADATLAAWQAATPRARRPLLEASRRKAQLGDARGALALLEQALALAPGERRTLEAVVTAAADLGNEALALKAHAGLHPDDRGEPGELEERAEVARRLGKPGARIEAAKALAAHPGASVGQVVRAADQLLAAGDEAGAREAYARAIAKDPSERLARALAARLSGTDPLAELAPFRRDGDSVLAAFAATEREKTASTTLVWDQMIIRVYADGSAVEETHQIRRINDVRGGESAQVADRPANADEVVRLRTIAVDKQSYVPNRVEEGFNMPRLEPGAFFEQEYRNYKESPVPGPRRSTTFYFQSQEEPYVQSQLVLILEEGSKGAVRTRNFGGTHETKALPGGLVAHVFTVKDSPRLPTEKHHPALEDLVPIVAFGEDGDPAPSARGMRAALLARTVSSPVVSAARVQACGKATSDLEKAQAIHRFVHESIPDGGGPDDPTTVLLLKKGSRFYLEAALLRDAGVPCELAASESQRAELSGDALPLFLGESRFHMPALLVSPSGAGPLWIFADTPRHAPLGFVPADRDGAAAALLREGAAERTTVRAAAPPESGILVRGVARLDKSGMATLEAKLTLRGTEGYYAAEQVRNLEQNVQQLAARQIAAEIFKGWNLKSIDLGAVKKAGGPLLASGVLTRRGAVRQVGDAAMLGLPLPPGAYLTELGDRTPRQLPFDLREASESAWEITIEPGDAWRIVALPAPVHVQHALLEYDLTFERSGTGVTVRRNVRTLPGTLPAATFEEWLRVLRALDLAEERQIKLVARQ